LLFFADDTTLFHSDKCPVHLHSVLTQDPCTLPTWSEVSKVTFKLQKTSVVTISSHRNDHPLHCLTIRTQLEQIHLNT